MTTAYHTPHPFGNAVDSAEFNSRLGTLDAAIVASTTAGFVGASTTTDASSASGQKVVPVTATTGFAVGDAVWIGFPGSGLVEMGTVNTIQAGISLTMLVNLTNTHATGTPVSRSPIEVVQSRGVSASLPVRLTALDTEVDGLNLAIFNVKAYGAVGNGVANDRVAIRAAIEACRVAGGGTVYLPPGNYLVDKANHPVALYGAGYPCAFAVPGNVAIRGAGRDATTITLDAAETLAGAIIYNYQLDPAIPTRPADDNIVLEDFTVDGDGANQTVLGMGVMLIRTNDASHNRVKVRNVFGDENGPPGEMFHFETQLGFNTTYVDCQAEGTAGDTATGFSANVATNVRYVGCSARGMGFGMGFTLWHCRNVQYVGCWAGKNAHAGFNTEESVDILYEGCIAGSRMTNLAGQTTWPDAIDTNLGNTLYGFVCNGSQASYVNCVAQENSTGLIVVVGNDSARARVVGGVYSENTVGIDIPTAAVMAASKISDAFIDNNSTAEIRMLTGTLTMATYPGVVPQPTEPASGVVLPNPYPFDVSISVVGGTITAAEIAGNTAHVGTYYRLPQRCTIKLTYTGTLLWRWTAE